MLLRDLLLGLEGFNLLLTGSVLDLGLLELQEVLSLHLNLASAHQAVVVIEATLI